MDRFKVLTGAEFDALRRANGELDDAAPTPAAGLSAGIGPVSGRRISTADTESSWGDGWALGAGTTGIDASTLLSGAQPFESAGHGPIGDFETMAARGVSEFQQAECFAEYERNLDECNLYKAMTDAAYTFIACKQNAFMLYNQCRGY